jgi:hypothetical protein
MSVIDDMTRSFGAELDALTQKVHSHQQIGSKQASKQALPQAGADAQLEASSLPVASATRLFSMIFSRMGIFGGSRAQR